jgi:hypothetical protein
MIRVRHGILMAAASFALGCVPNPTLYEWGQYEQTLHAAYKNPSAIPEFQAELLGLIQASELNGSPPPPGIYAEYGYALYLRGQFNGAIVYFAKERETWPESAVLMTTVIKRLEGRLEEEKVEGAAAAEGVAPPAATGTVTESGGESASNHGALAVGHDESGPAKVSGGEQ